eukprot:CAMPEP_0114109306 /NCGR_PEP_ID=MMETSP0043_2-20121206/707_1 /TAXON_ID=464988 /ORGANISM="Hemiselmis andersenii, Strain CCMP644" /LENGTH=182 /DNA_ID=CAMNT_0001201177 /DNA_START=223 /DNA_END=772 /DNA_ORIENTATION=-
MVDVLALDGAVHQRPVVAQSIPAQQAHCWVVAPRWHLVLLAVPHRRRHPVRAHLGAVSTEDPEVEAEEEQDAPHVGEQHLQPEDVGDREEVSHDHAVPRRPEPVARLVHVVEKGETRLGVLSVGEGATSRKVHGVGGPARPEDPAREEFVEVKLCAEKEGYDPEPEARHLLVTLAVLFLPVN